jgi:non-heme Fe2+,alpha-ketoglutarate-dependent halogenase
MFAFPKVTNAPHPNPPPEYRERGLNILMKTRYPELEPTLDLQFKPIFNPAPRFFTAAQIDHYNAHGYINNVPIFMPAQLAAVQKYVAENRQNFVPKTSAFLPFHHTLKGQYDITTNAAILDHLTDLIGPNIIAHTSNFVPRDPGGGDGVPWHHDASFNPMDARSVVVWTAFRDAFVENGCMWFIPGSHLLGAVDCDTNAGHVVRNATDYGKPVPIEVRAGHAVFFSDLLLHNSGSNKTADKPRDAFTATYCAAELKVYLDGDKWSILCRGNDVHRHWRVNPAPVSG